MLVFYDKNLLCFINFFHILYNIYINNITNQKFDIILNTSTKVSLKKYHKINSSAEYNISQINMLNVNFFSLNDWNQTK